LLPAPAGFLLSLLFKPKDGGNTFLKHIMLCQYYMVLQP
jgi:hypothetical protein